VDGDLKGLPEAPNRRKFHAGNRNYLSNVGTLAHEKQRIVMPFAELATAL
jgi:hypothetical protein